MPLSFFSEVNLHNRTDGGLANNAQMRGMPLIFTSLLLQAPFLYVNCGFGLKCYGLELLTLCSVKGFE